MTAHLSLETFFEKLNFAIQNRELVKLVLSKKKTKSSLLNKITITPVEIKGEYLYSFVYQFETKDTTKNFPQNESFELIRKELGNNFLNADFFGTEENVQLLGNLKGHYGLKISQPLFKEIKNLKHNREKEILIEKKGNIYLRELGITNAEGEIRPGMHDKFRQINKYIEIVSQLIENGNFENEIRIADMGSGKGYLTFALYDYIKNKTQIKPIIHGIEFRKELVDLCNITAVKSGFENLLFTEGTIEKNDVGNIDMLIALHACDTATDGALAKGINASARLIITAPCCQKQVRKHMNPTGVLSSLLKHGILKERQAELLTDGIRALILEAKGYKTKVFEFISTEHTPKNVMIVAEKTKNTRNSHEIFDKIDQIKALFGIEFHYLETLPGIRK